MCNYDFLLAAVSTGIIWQKQNFSTVFVQDEKYSSVAILMFFQNISNNFQKLLFFLRPSMYYLQLQTFSVSYLRCLLEHARCYLLDRDIELVYYSIRKSTDILTRDTFQLGTQVGTYY